MKDIEDKRTSNYYVECWAKLKVDCELRVWRLITSQRTWLSATSKERPIFKLGDIKYA